jgi:lysozyme family protein
MRDLPREIAQEICYNQYWTPLRLDEFDPEIGFQILNAHYNTGRGVWFMQQAAGAYTDGIIGPRTVAAVKAADPVRFIARFIGFYQTHLLGCKQRDGSWAFPVFGRGWIKRTTQSLMEGIR